MKYRHLSGCTVRLFIFALLALPCRVFAGPPVFTRITPASGIQGATVAVSITGTDLVAGNTQLSPSGPGLVIVSVRVLDETHLNALLILNGPPGVLGIRISTPAGTSNALQFQMEPSALDAAAAFHVDHVAGLPGSLG